MIAINALFRSASIGIAAAEVVGSVRATGAALLPKRRFDFASGRNGPIVSTMNADEAAIEEARRAGFDLDLIDSNLALTPEQRALRHESALELVLELREAAATYEKSARTPAEIR